MGSVLGLFLLGLFLSVSVSAKNYFYYIGGGGEVPTEENQFDNPLRAMSETIGSLGKDWRAVYLHNGGHPQSDVLKEGLKKKGNVVEDFTPESYRKYLTQIKNDLESGKITKKDQLFIHVNTHGHKFKNGDNNISHSISTSKTTDGFDFESVSLDELLPILETAKKKGVLVGIYDGSCHSGATLNLAKNLNNVCAMSSSDYRVSYGDPSVSENIYREIKEGDSLEDVFLKARKKNYPLNYPQISSDIGIGLERMLRFARASLGEYNHDELEETKTRQYHHTGEGCAYFAAQVFEEIRVIEEKILPRANIETEKLKNLFNKYYKFVSEIDKKSKKYQEKRQAYVDEYGLAQVMIFCSEDGAFCEEVKKAEYYDYYEKGDYPAWFCELAGESNCKEKEEIHNKIKKEVSAKFFEWVKNGSNEQSDFGREWKAHYYTKNMKTKEQWMDYQFRNSSCLTSSDHNDPNSGCTIRSEIQYMQSEIMGEINKLYNDLYEANMKNGDKNNACKKIKF